MRVVGLEATNVKRLRAVELHFDDDHGLVEIAGNNGQGKTSLLDTIYMALAGAGAAPKRPIRQGADKATIKLDLGEFLVERKFTAAGKTYLRVTSPDGEAEYRSPQAMLDSLVSSLTFDPFAFSRLPPRQQVDQLKMVLGLDFADLDGQRADFYQRRTEVNRRRDDTQARLAVIPEDPECPKEHVRVGDLMDELTAIAAEARDKRELAQRVTSARRQVEDLRQEAAALKAKLEEVHKRGREAVAFYEQASRENDAAGEPRDPEPIEKQIREAQAINDRVSAKQERFDLVAKATALGAQSAELTGKIEQVDHQKRRAIEAAKLPVEGLEITDEELLLRGVPFEQAGQGEKIRVGMALALAADPKLRVMLIRDAAFLDDDGMNLLGQLAEEHDFQIWAERVAPWGKTAIVIEDGAVRETEQE